MADEKTGFVDGHVEAVIEDHPADHTSPVVCGACGKTGDLQCPHCKSTNVMTDGPPAGRNLEMMDKLRRVLLWCHDHKNSKYAMGCFLIATGDPAAAGVTMTEYARHWGVTRAAVSKECCFIIAMLGIVPSAYMKSEESKQSFRKSNRRPIKTK